MNTVRSLSNVTLCQRGLLTIGSFDGVHRGHQHLLGQLVAAARKAQCPSVVLTFYPHPRAVLSPASRPTYLSSPEDRAALIEALGINQLVVLPFTEELAETHADDFMCMLWNSMHMTQVWVGSDFALGRQRGGNLRALRQLSQQLGFALEAVPAMQIDGRPVSSTRIRAALAAGDVAEAEKLLGRPYAYSGDVVAGEQRGRQLGFRTANLEPPIERAMPANGVYAVWALVDDERHKAVANVGVRPSFGSGRRLLEVHLLDHSEDLYGRRMSVQFVRFLRPEVRFDGVDALTEQIRADVDEARRVLAATS